MKTMKKENDFDVRMQFGQLDAAILLTPAQVGQVIGSSSTQAVYTALYRRDLPEPFIRRNRQIRWTVGQLKEHLAKQMQAFVDRQAAQAAGTGAVIAYTGKKRGRPRLVRDTAIAKA